MHAASPRYANLIIVLLTIIILNVVLSTISLFFTLNSFNGFWVAYLKFPILFNFGWIIFIYSHKVYVTQKSVSFDFYLKHKLKLYIFVIALSIIYLFFLNQFAIFNFLTISTLLCYGIHLILYRSFYLYFGSSAGSKQIAVKRVLILGYNKVGQKLADYFERNEIKYCLVGFSENDENMQELSHYPIVSDISHTIDVSKKLNVSDIYITISPEKNNDLYSLIYKAENECIRVIIVPDLTNIIQKPVHVQYFGDIPLLLLRSEPLENIANRFIKRAFDIFISSFVIIFILSWLVPLIGCLIQLESPGPIFFKQLRTGRNKKQFLCLKFRSMKLNSDAHLIQATKNDGRVTKLGRILRKTSLDEFPQFLNVLTGSMSLVGPRPHMLKHTHDYSQIVNQFMIRQFLKPGITGWAQVNGFRGEITTKKKLEKRLEYDIWYLENWNFLLDLKIIFQTITNAVKGEENAF